MRLYTHIFLTSKTNKQMKHTTGQWNAVAQMPEGYSIETNEGKVIAFTQCDEDYNSENPIIRAEEMANAKLIAAAPKLLEIVLKITEDIEDGKINTKNGISKDSYVWHKLNNAIKAATE